MRAATAIAFVIILAAPCAAHAWSPFMKENGKVKKGNKLLAKGQAAKALAKYSAALGDLPDRAGVHFNKGVAHYNLAKDKEEARGENLQESVKSLLGAIDLASDEERDLRGKAFYNLGNVYYLGERWEEAAESYRQALKLLPGDKDAAFNLALALKKIEEQRKKEEEEKKKQEEEQKEKEKQEQEQQEKEQDDQQKEEEEEQEEDQQEQEQDQQEKQEDDQQCDQGKEKGKDQQQEQEQKQGQEKEQGDQQQKQEQQQEQQKKQQQQGETQQQEQQPQPVPLTKQQTEAILDALQRGEKNYHLEALKNYGKGKAKILKDW
ncbi:MAG: tetratricopeptide repeat protein [Pseudomonadota bacterium]